MASTPPPPPPGRAGTVPAEQTDRLARLERLARRRAEGDGSSARTGRQQSTNPTARTTSAAPPRGAGDAGRTTPTPEPSGRTGRRHPAKGARAAALGMSLMTTAGLAGLFALTNRPAAADSVDAAAVIVSGTNGALPTRAPAVDASASGASAPASTGSTTTGSTVVDGGVSGTKWGPVQVEATFAPDGTLTGVTALQTPDDRSKSVAINEHAVPRLTKEALSAQTANVDTISGATYTSDGYRQSLQSAIDAARAAGVTTIA